MKYFFAFFCGAVFCAMSGGAVANVAYLQLGAACNKFNSSTICLPGLICVAYDDGGNGYCNVDCNGSIIDPATEEETWSDTGHEFQTRTCWSCDSTSECAFEEQYRCVAGYYGIMATPDDYCYQCPLNGESVNGTPVIEGCYLANGKSYNDDTGAFLISGGNCQY